MQGRSGDQRELLDAESVAGHLLKPGSVFAFLAEHRRRLFPDEMFADLFRSGRGRPSVPADVIAAVLVLQTLHGLSDAETVDAVTFDLRWKAAVGWPVTASAFHATTLTYWCRRLAASADPNRIFTAVKELVAASGALKGRTARALDSTILDDAVATQDTVTQLVAAIRKVARLVPAAGPIVAGRAAAGQLAHDYTDPGKPKIAWDDAQARAVLIDALVRDALAVLAGLPEQPPGPGGDAVGLLALVAGQDVELIDPGPDDPDGGVAGPRWRDRPTGRAGPGDQYGRHPGPARAQDGAPPPGRVQGAPGDRTGHRPGHRLRDQQRVRRRQQRRRRRGRPAHRRDRAPERAG